MTCTALREVACELALDVLSGDERADALAHLETCAGCRQEVTLLTAAAEELLVLAPDVEPSAWFEQRVLRRVEVDLVHSYGATVDAPYWVAIQSHDGSRDLYRLPPAEDHPWNVAIDSKPSAVVAVSLVDNEGVLWCTAQLS